MKRHTPVKLLDVLEN